MTSSIVPPASVLRDKAHRGICKAACDALLVPKGSKRLPMFSKTDVQKKAGFPYFNARRWDDIVFAVENFDWREIQEHTGERQIEWVKRETPIQLLGLTEHAFRSTHYVVEYEDELVGGAEAKRVPTVRAVNPKDELRRLERAEWDDDAKRVASRFIAQDARKKTAGYGSVEIAGGRLAWRWLETVGQQIEHRRGKAVAVKESLQQSGLLPGQPVLALARG